jgi:sugar phosphate isomerase/epimerase
MNLGKGLGLLTYSTLVHPGDTWDEMWNSLTTYVPRVKERVSPRDSFGVSLRLSAASAELLVKNKEKREQLKKFLGDNDMFLYTVNAFPYGPFKGRTVKEQVYEPDWRTDERTQYTINVAEILGDVAPAGTAPSIQSAPLGFKPRVTSPEVVAQFTEHVLQVASRLVDIRERTGRTVGLALEPEPFCFLETTDETVDYFTKHLYSGAASSRLAKLAGIPISEALDSLRRHVGVVFDICHQAVEYENISESLQKLVDAGIPVFKLQEAAALYVPRVTQQSIDILKRYAETIYLTQTIEKKDGQFSRFLNLEDAFATWRPSAEAREWRTHIHVPVFLDDLGAFRTTRFAIEDALRFHKANPLSRQLEIETYTWDVLPDSLKTGDIVDYVCREIEWVRSQLS